MCTKGCKVHINIRKTTCLSFSPSFVAKHETFLFFSHRPKPSISETCVLGHKQGKIRQKLDPPLYLCSCHLIVLKPCIGSYKPIIHCFQHLWCLEHHIFYFKVSVCDFEGLILCCDLHKQEHVKLVFFSDSNTQNFDTSNHAHTNFKGCVLSHASCVYPWFLISSILLSFIDDSFFRPPQTCVLDTFQGKTAFSSLSVNDSINNEDMDLRPVPYT